MEDYSKWTVEELRGMIVGHDAVIWCLNRAMAALEGVRIATRCFLCRREMLDALMSRPDGIDRFLSLDDPMNEDARRAMDWILLVDSGGEPGSMLDDVL